MMVEDLPRFCVMLISKRDIYIYIQWSFRNPLTVIPTVQRFLWHHEFLLFAGQKSNVLGCGLNPEDRLREAIPDIYLLTDVICGYPTETEEAVPMC